MVMEIMAVIRFLTLLQLVEAVEEEKMLIMGKMVEAEAVEEVQALLQRVQEVKEVVEELGHRVLIKPQAAAAVPERKSSAIREPSDMGWSKWHWLSTPPGRTSLPAASMPPLAGPLIPEHSARFFAQATAPSPKDRRC